MPSPPGNRSQADLTSILEGLARAGAGHNLLMTDLGPLDALGAVEGGRSYDDLCTRTVTVEVAGWPIAVLELEADGLQPEDALEAILCAPTINKVLRSRSVQRRSPRETLYVIVGVSFTGTPVYTKGVIRKEDGRDVLYILVSSKRSLS